MTGDRFSPARERWVGLLRVVSSACLVLLALAVFERPLTLVLGPRAIPAVSRIPLPALLGPRPARGFMVKLVSEPSGAQVLIDGAERGSAPLFANVACENGQEVAIEVVQPGYPPWRRTVSCRVGGDLTVRARLGQ